jgi:hypothetical protein
MQAQWTLLPTLAVAKVLLILIKIYPITQRLKLYFTPQIMVSLPASEKAI